MLDAITASTISLSNPFFKILSTTESTSFLSSVFLEGSAFDTIKSSTACSDELSKLTEILPPISLLLNAAFSGEVS